MKKLTLNTIFILGFVVFSFFVFPQTAKASLNTDYVELIVTYSYPNGTACSTDDECDSNHCIDGYCCDTTCTTTCMACNLAGNLGICTNIPVDTDPDSDCGTTDCYTGNCDGAAACKFYSGNEKGSCSTCYYCNDADSDCDFVTVDTDPNSDCSVGSLSCDGGCRTQRDSGDCDGAGACGVNDEKSNCSAGHSCSGTACGDANYCNATLAYCSNQGDGYYNDGGNSYQCQGSCDGSNNCDYADNCSVVSSFDNSFKFGGNLQMSGSGLSFDFREDPCEACSCEGTGYQTLTCAGDTVYVDCNADKCWTPTAGSTYQWGGYGIDEPTDSCIGIAGRPACNYCDNLNYGGKTDWVLPNSSILGALCNSGSCSGTCFGGDGNFTTYWSSTEQNSNFVYSKHFFNCDTLSHHKNNSFEVRCVR